MKKKVLVTRKLLRSNEERASKLWDAKLNLNDASKTDLIKLSKNIEKEMNLAADLLEFELAARLRDELKELKKEINNYSE